MFPSIHILRKKKKEKQLSGEPEKAQKSPHTSQGAHQA